MSVLALAAAPAHTAAPSGASPAYALIRVGPWAVPLTDQQRACMDRLIARARARQLPFLSILDDTRRECVAFTVEPVPDVATLATGVPV